MKGKNYEMKVRPAIMYGLKTVANKKKNRRGRAEDAKTSTGSDQTGPD